MCHKYSDSGFPGSCDEIIDSRSRASIQVEGSKPSVEEREGGGTWERWKGKIGGSKESERGGYNKGLEK